MLISYKKILEIQPNLAEVPFNELLQSLMNLGCEVEQVNPVSNIDKISCLQIIDRADHPQLNKVQVIFLNNDNQKLQIVTNQLHLMIGDWVLVAHTGAKIGNFTITERDFKGVVSYGMLLGIDELDYEHASYYSKIDRANAIATKEVEQALTLLDDLYIKDLMIDLSLPSNRNELNSYHYIIKELSALYNFVYDKNETINIQPLTSDIISVNTNIIRSYFLTKITNFDTTVSLKQKVLLAHHKIVVHNNFNDHLNYLTLMTSNPMHCFDADKVVGKLFVRELTTTTRMVGIDQQTYDLLPGDLVLTDDTGVIALCGIMGAASHAVDNQTKNVYIECANFDFTYVKKTANRLKINSNAASLFSKPLNESVTLLTVKYLQNYFKNYQKLLFATFEEPTTSINVNWNKLYQVLGTNDINIKQAQEFLIRLGYLIAKDNVIAPVYRTDVLNEYDVFEDVIKLYDINKIPALPIASANSNKVNNFKYDVVYQLKEKLINNNLVELKTYHLKPESKAYAFNWYYPNQKTYDILNPLSSSKAHLKLNNIDSVLDALTYNLHYKNDLQNVFEITEINQTTENKALNITIALSSFLFYNSFEHQGLQPNLLVAKNFAQLIADHLGLKLEYLANDDAMELNTNQSLKISFKNQLTHGYLGLLKQNISQGYDFIDPVYLVSLNIPWDLIQPKQPVIYQPISSFHDIIKDFSIPLNNQTNLNKILASLRKIKQVHQVYVYDVYIKDTHTVYTFRVHFNNNSRIISNDEIISLMKEIQALLESYQIN
ncbi:phenylalanine--tRNA ligase subunit beta [Ureaplasma sp. ES3154-GEN]|uniref:phenylalanine--tRNA ligase subunit beta n=1 Tax=Ureaplasma sp. ES3154-GEN TaxID=2984844 RepID=UPI0021E77388|nr:phenylalanine--tRNA ligase subunit beta [Ureaplasma sp. ES3154-GEN]MCV3743341.1 phenylalanine--tRNA ligase subunit beta [Ureaplasma sp. ES3154-GEN]